MHMNKIGQFDNDFGSKTYERSSGKQDDYFLVGISLLLNTLYSTMRKWGERLSKGGYLAMLYKNHFTNVNVSFLEFITKYVIFKHKKVKN